MYTFFSHSNDLRAACSNIQIQLRPNDIYQQTNHNHHHHHHHYQIAIATTTTTINVIRKMKTIQFTVLLISSICIFFFFFGFPFFRWRCCCCHYRCHCCVFVINVSVVEDVHAYKKLSSRTAYIERLRIYLFFFSLFFFIHSFICIFSLESLHFSRSPSIHILLFVTLTDWVSFCCCCCFCRLFSPITFSSLVRSLIFTF